MYTVTYVNPNNAINHNSYTSTGGKAHVRELVRKERMYPGSMEILSITKTTKARGVESVMHEFY